MMPRVFILLNILFVSQLAAVVDFVTRYEVFTAGLLDISEPKHSYRRSAASRRTYKLQFTQFNHHFNVVLNRRELFAQDPVLALYDGKRQRRELPLDTSRYYQGRLADEPNSRVHGIVLPDGTFDGVIFSRRWNNSFYVEPTSRYPQLDTNGSQLIYRFTDLDFSKYPYLIEKAKGVRVPRPAVGDRIPASTTVKTPGDRHRRDAGGSGNDTSQLVEQQRLTSMHCSLHVYIDHRFYKHIGKSSVAGTIDEAIYHIGQANVIFRSTSFDGHSTSSNIGFIIAKITLYKTEDSDPVADVKSGADAQSFLDRFSLLNHTNFCLGVMFTVVDFADGVLGLAWIASPDLTNSGICSAPYPLRNGTDRYFNTGIISSINYGNLIPRPMFSITVTHELGHNFGAEHDDPNRYSCAPGGPEGNYIMFHLSGDGLKSNQFLFSPCSINNIYKILSGRMNSCFKTTYVTYCSNAIIDEGEEQCDCGSQSTCESLDPCCTVYKADSSSQCTLKPTSKCSAMASRCCDPETCDFVPASEKKVCSLSSECTEKAYCDGLGTECPTAPNLDDGTLCYDNRKICVNGQCAEPVCKYHGYVDCYCEDTVNDCHVCCQSNSTAECLPASHFGLSVGLEGALPVNALCKDGRGICDESGLCVFLDGTYDRADLPTLIKDSASNVLHMLGTYWYYAITVLATLITLVGVFVSIHKSNKPLQSMAYKDGRMAYVWFEARYRLANIEEELERLENYDEPPSFPYSVASRRIVYQFPTAPQSLVARYLLQCDRELEVVKLLLLQGYPMRKLLMDDVEEEDD